MIIPITRKIDKSGRVTIPVEILNCLGWKENTEVRFEVSKTGSLIIRKSKLKDFKTDENIDLQLDEGS